MKFTEAKIRNKEMLATFWKGILGDDFGLQLTIICFTISENVVEMDEPAAKNPAKFDSNFPDLNPSRQSTLTFLI